MKSFRWIFLRVQQGIAKVPVSGRGNHFPPRHHNRVGSLWMNGIQASLAKALGGNGMHPLAFNKVMWEKDYYYHVVGDHGVAFSDLEGSWLC